MIRAVLTLLVVPVVVLSAPPPKGADKKAELYFPTKVGAKRVYEVTYNGKTTEQTTEVTTAEEKDGVWRIAEESDAPTPVALKSGLTHEVSAKGITLVARGEKDLPTPQPLLKLPAKTGDTWDYDPTPANRPAGLPSLVMTYTVGTEEEIEVPAGRYRAIPVESKRGGPPGAAAGLPVTATQWYAPGVGLVKAVTKLGERERVMSLKSFAPGK